MFALQRCVWCGNLASEESQAGDPLCGSHAALERLLDQGANAKPS
jgi:hypothetical protein